MELNRRGTVPTSQERKEIPEWQMRDDGASGGLMRNNTIWESQLEVGQVVHISETIHLDPTRPVLEEELPLAQEWCCHGGFACLGQKESSGKGLLNTFLTATASAIKTKEDPKF